MVKYIVECSSVRICLVFFSQLDWFMSFREESQRGKISFSSDYIKSTSFHLSLLVLTLITRLR